MGITTLADRKLLVYGIVNPLSRACHKIMKTWGSIENAAT